MRLDPTGRLVFDNTLEARVVSHLLISEGLSELANHIVPRLDSPMVSMTEFIVMTQNTAKSYKDGSEYGFTDALVGAIALKQLSKIAGEYNKRKTILTRKQFLRNMLADVLGNEA